MGASAPSEFRLGGRVLFAALLGTACGASPLPFNVLPLVMGPIHDEFGWDFAAISVGLTIWGVTASLLAPVVGALSDRIGVRTVALWSLFAFALMFAAVYFVPGSLSGWYGFWLLLADGLGLSRSEVRRAVREGGAYLNNRKVTDETAVVEGADWLHGRFAVLRRGKRTVAVAERSREEPAPQGV